MGLFFTSLAEKQEVVFRQDKKFECLGMRGEGVVKFLYYFGILDAVFLVLVQGVAKNKVQCQCERDCDESISDEKAYDMGCAFDRPYV